MNDVTQAELDKFKSERKAENEFLDKVRVLVGEFAAKVSPQNVVYKQVKRFLASHV